MKNKFLKTIVCLAVMFALAACSSEEMADGTQLPEGKYPITFTATGLEAMAVSRTTADGTWAGSEKVAVSIGNVTKEYAADATGKLTSNTPFYWKSTSDSYTVTAWMTDGGTTYSPTFNGFQLNPEQNSEENYQSNDFLYAHDILSYNENKSLTFYHQTGKVVVHVLSGDDTPASMNINKLGTRNLYVSADWVAPEIDKGDYGTSTTSGTAMSITPYPLGKMGITLPDKTTATTLASYKFLIVPQKVTGGSPLFTITADGYAPFIYTPAGNRQWEAGREYTYYITINGSKVNATVTTTKIDWTGEGATGEGRVEI